MKKFIYICLTLISLFVFEIAFGFSQNIFASSELYYVENSDGETLSVSGVMSLSTTEVVIPNDINGMPITNLAVNQSSDGCFGFRSPEYIDLITSLDLTGATSLKTIARGAFSDCVNLSGEIYLPSSMTSVGRNAFSGTQISRVVVNNSTSITSVGSSSFPDDIEIVFPSYSVLNMYSTDTNWNNISTNTFYKITIEIDGEEQTLNIIQKPNQAFGSNYDLIMEYLESYNVGSIKQGDVNLTKDTVADGTNIIVTTQEVSIDPETENIPVNRKYGQQIVLSATSIDNAEYSWTFENNPVDNTTNTLTCSTLEVDTYTAVCTISQNSTPIRIETFNITIEKADYYVNYPSKINFEYFEFSSDIILDNFNLEDVSAKFYFGGNEVESFSKLGEYQVVIELKDAMTKNYELKNGTFSFNIVQSELTISWPASTYNYTSKLITPAFEIIGNTWDSDVNINVSANTKITAKEVGQYVIEITGLTNPYFKFSEGTQLVFNWEIVKTTLTVKWELNSFTYSNEAYTPVAYGENGDIKVQLEVSELSTGNKTFKDANTYNLIAVLPTEYTGFELQGNNTSTCTIAPAKIESEFVSESVHSYTGEMIEVVAEITTQLSEEVELIISGNKYKEVGEYTAKITGVTNSNYCIDEITFDWQIVSTILTIVWGDNEFTYTSNSITPTAYAICGNIRIPLIVSELNSGNKNFVNANTYQLVATLPDGYEGFELQGETTNTLTIDKVRLDVAFTSNDEYTYNGTEIEVVAEILTDINEDVDLVITGNRYKDAGEYTAVVEGVNNANYYIENEVTFDWKINKKVLIVNWIPNITPLKFVYTGGVQVPKASVVTGIDGENITLVVEAGKNKNANEDSASGYTAVAKLPLTENNYSLSNTTKEYFITRAQAHINVAREYEVVYNGKNQLPNYTFVGDKNALKITMNGLEITTGVKDPGTYEIVFSSVKSQNYNALLENKTCFFTIKKAEVVGTTADGNDSVMAISNDGFQITDLPVNEIENFEMPEIESENIDKFKLYKVISVGSDNYSLPVDTKLYFSLNTNKNVRIFLYKEDGCIEKELELVDSKIVLTGGSGTYIILVEKQNWFTSTAGITTMSISAFVIVVGILMTFMLLRPNKSIVDREINKQLEVEIKKKAMAGEELTTDDIKRLRKEIKDKVLKDNKTNKNTSK